MCGVERLEWIFFISLMQLCVVLCYVGNFCCACSGIFSYVLCILVCRKCFQVCVTIAKFSILMQHSRKDVWWSTDEGHHCSCMKNVLFQVAMLELWTQVINYSRSMCRYESDVRLIHLIVGRSTSRRSWLCGLAARVPNGGGWSTITYFSTSLWCF